MLTRSLQEVAAAPSPGPFEPCSSDSDEEEVFCSRKRPGRLQTRPTFSLDGNAIEDGLLMSADDDDDFDDGDDEYMNSTSTSIFGPLAQQMHHHHRQRRRRQLLQSKNLATTLSADKLWAQGYRGSGVKMGVFDTGIRADHPDVKNIKERTNWTHEPTLEDGLGHGSFVAGVIAGTSPLCPGLAPEVAIYTFRVFTNDQVSYTSWFLDAFNYAIVTEMDVVNLSIGGPDHLDHPFVEKVGEVTGAGIIMISAIGNDGPLYGTLNNPADQNDVIGVGGIDWNSAIASFSSRGMSAWELPLGYGRSKPDVMAYGRDVQGSRITGGCRGLSGTSVASPVVAGAVCLLASTMSLERRRFLNPASMKQALIEGAARLPDLNMYEQGQGQLDVLGAAKVLSTYKPRASIVPARLNLTECPFAWPFCLQPVYAGAMPLMFNATILNGMGVVGRLEEAPVWTASDEGGRLLDVRFEWPRQLWPWSGHLGVFLRVKPTGGTFSGVAHGTVNFTVISPPIPGEDEERRSEVTWDIVVEIIPTPPREKRILWDQFHSVRYPPAYFPRDDLSVRHDILDWHGDHPHTNFHDMYDFMREKGYFLEVLGSPATCFSAEDYGALMIVDSEDEFYPEEIKKIAGDVMHRGLGLIVFADWYDVDSVRKMRFYDDNTRGWWEAATGGANVPALNDVLAPLGAALAGGSYELDVDIPGAGGIFRMASGSAIAAFPAGGFLHNVTQVRTTSKGDAEPATKAVGVPVLGLSIVGSGRLVLYGDSNCLDSSHQKSNCHGLLEKVLAFAAEKRDDDEGVQALLQFEAQLKDVFGSLREGLPERRPDYNFTEASFVLQNDIKCYPNSPLKYQGLEYQGDEAGVSGGGGSSSSSIGGDSQKEDDENNKFNNSSSSSGVERSPGEATIQLETRIDGGGTLSTRDIAAQREEEQRHSSINENKYRIDDDDLDYNDDDEEEEEGNELKGMGTGDDDGVPPPVERLANLNVMQLPQIFSIVGGFGVVLVWVSVRRRRPRSVASGEEQQQPRRRMSLPLFLRPDRRRGL